MRGVSLYTPPSPCSTSISWGSSDGRLAPHRFAAAVRQPALLRTPRRLRVLAVSGSTDGGVGQQAAARLQDAVNAARPHTSRFTKQLGVKCVAHERPGSTSSPVPCNATLSHCRPAPLCKSAQAEGCSGQPDRCCPADSIQDRQQAAHLAAHSRACRRVRSPPWALLKREGAEVCRSL